MAIAQKIKRTARKVADDPIAMLKEDHSKVKELFRTWARTSPGAIRQRGKIRDSICQELEIHARIEEELFYPTVKERLQADDKGLVDEGYAEHSTITKLVDQARYLDPESGELSSTIEKLIEVVNHHIEEEEHRMFPVTRPVINGDKTELALRMKGMKAALKGARLVGIA